MKKNLYLSKSLFAILVIAIFQSGCRKDEELIEHDLPNNERFNPGNYDSQVIQDWYRMELEFIKVTAGHTPPVAARELGYSGVALYEALLVGGTVNNHSLAGQLNSFGTPPRKVNGQKYAAPLVANATLAQMIRNLFGNLSAANKLRVDSLESAIVARFANEFQSAEMIRSRDFGYDVANFVFNYSKTDGGHEAYLNVFPAYTPPTGVDKWVPTPPLYQSAMLPSWGNNRTFVPSNGTGPIDPPAPVLFASTVGSAFYNEALTVYNTVNNLTASQQEIANFWADGANTTSPPGHLMAIALQVIRTEGLNLSQAATVTAKVGIGLSDAGIVCWRSKFNYDLLRPITFIRNYIDPNWNSYIATPPFPTYTSGHSSFSGATAKLLSLTFGNNYSFTDSTKSADGFSPRSFSNFNAAASEAAISRLYGGIHYTFDNNNGMACGQNIGANVASLNW